MRDYLERVNRENNMGWDNNFIENCIKYIYKKYGYFCEYDEFTKIFDEMYGIKEDYSEIDFNDEIESIEYIGEEELIDIEVSHDNLFYANDILTHNSAIGNTEAGMENISESLKIAMTADVAIMLINNDQMKEQNQQIWKLVKNRYTGQMPSLMMETDFTRMTYRDFNDDSAYEAVDQVELNTGSLTQPVGNGLDFGQLKF